MFKRGFFLFLFGTGVFLLVQVVMPLVSYKVWEMTLYKQETSLASAIPTGEDVLGIKVESFNSFPGFVSSKKRSEPLPYSEFYLSADSINLDKIQVKVETNDFEKNLAHLPGTALPGERGNVFITGHSSFSQLYSPGNFKAIFAKLPDIKKGDQLIIDASSQRYIYEVRSLKIVDPKETWVINPPEPNGRYLTLMTCVPPGLYLKRLVVLAELK